METLLSRYWWLLALRGALAILFGLGALVWPGPTLGALVLLFGAYALTDGIFAVIGGVRQYSEQQRWGALLLEGIVGIVAGVLTFVWPGLTALALLSFIAVWALLTGVLELVAAIRLRKEIRGEWALGLSGIASILFGLLLIVFPASGALTVVWLIGAYALLFGALMVVLAFRVRNHTERFSHGAARAA